MRTYNDAPMLGGGVSYALVRGSVNKNFDRDIYLHASVSNSIGGASWKHTAYEGGFVMSLFKSRLLSSVWASAAWCHTRQA